MNIRMSTKGKRPLRSLTPNDKIHAIQRIHDGESKASVARDIGVPESTLRGWCKNEDKLRFMSRQLNSDKMTIATLPDKMDNSCNLVGPAEKRQKFDPSLPLNFSNKSKFNEGQLKRTPYTDFNYSDSSLSDLSYKGVPSTYIPLNGNVKNKTFGADVTGPIDPSIAAASPLSTLTHLSGLNNLTPSPLAISFNELSSNINILAQLNPSLAAMTGLNGITSTANILRNISTKAQLNSPQRDNNERSQVLPIKNWQKTKMNVADHNDFKISPNMSTSMSEINSKIKGSNPHITPSLNNNIQSLATFPEDPIFYWLKSHQAILGLNNMYPPSVSLAETSPPIPSSTPEPRVQASQIPAKSLTPPTISNSPSSNLQEHNTPWMNWCKMFGTNLNSLAPGTALHINQNTQLPTSTTIDTHTSNIQNTRPLFENILYSHLIKEEENSLTHSPIDQSHSNEVTSNTNDSANKPEDLSAKSTKSKSSTPSPIPTPTTIQSPTYSSFKSQNDTPPQSPVMSSEADTATIDRVLSEDDKISIQNIDKKPDEIDNCEKNNNNNNINNNNNFSAENNDTDSMEYGLTMSEDDEAIKHGEKFLKWLENCSNPRITTVQLMQLKFLISAIKSANTCKSNIKKSDDHLLSEADSISSEITRIKNRRRK